MGANANNKSLKNNGIENSMLSILFLAGTIGVFYIMKHPDQSQEKNGLHHETYMSPDANRAYLDISDQKEQHLPVSFVISTYNEHVHYVLDLGNGERKEVRDARTSYTYRKSGAYRVKLIARHRNEEKVLFSDMIYINPGDDLADSDY